MPREIVHWHVLDSAISGLSPEKSSAVRQCLEANRAAAYLGAIAHDAPYYYKWGKNPEFTEVAEYLHGLYENDTFDPLRLLAEKISLNQRLDERNALWAFLLGMISHYVVDVLFHPMIYYTTGDYYHTSLEQRGRARRRHRLFEVYLESWCRKHAKPHFNGKASSVVSQLGSNFELICDLLDSTFAPELFFPDQQFTPEPAGRWERSFRDFSFLQKLFMSNTSGFVVRIVSKFHAPLREYDALASFGRRGSPKAFEKPIDYQNPVTGEEHSVTLTALEEQAIMHCVELFRRFEMLISGKTSNSQDAILEVKGLSLNVGAYRSGRDSPKYFSTTGIDVPGLKIS